MMPTGSRLHFLDRGSSHVIWMLIVIFAIAATCIKIWFHVRSTGTHVLRCVRLPRKCVTKLVTLESRHHFV